MRNRASEPSAESLLVPVILCGGSGTRLWPLSRALFPKQFVKLTGETSLFQQSVQRAQLCQQVLGIEPASCPALIVCNEEHRFLAQSQLDESGVASASLVLEPDGRNTAPALTLAAHAVNDDAVLLVMPADQTVQNLKGFAEAVGLAYRCALSEDTIVTLGVRPTRAETGYGYIEPISEIQPSHPEGVRVSRFVEKPTAQVAEQYFHEGRMLWNAGIFVVRKSVWLQAITTHDHAIAQWSEKSWQLRSQDTLKAKTSYFEFLRPDKATFQQCPSQSIDYAVMEKLGSGPVSASVVALDVGWNDLGSWDAVWAMSAQDAQGNGHYGDAVFEESQDCFVSSSGRLVAVVGLQKVVVVETPDAVLVAHQAKSQSVKTLVERLNAQGRPEREIHRKVHRPWGWYDSIDEDDGFKVKRIMVRPGASLSLQKHKHRAEHWVVVRGEATIQVGEKVFQLTANQSTYIPQGEVHRLSNHHDEPLEIIEIQSGSYLGEDDIVRLDDVYGRTAS